MSRTTTAYISLGSNTPDATNALAQAKKSLAALPEVQIAALSKIYRTEPQNMREQPWFLNQAARLELGWQWRPLPFVNTLLALEKKLGRKRGDDPALRFGPRRIDLDLLLFGDERSSHPLCVLPHPRMLERAFVLYPLKEIAPNLIISGRSTEEWLNSLDWKLEDNRIYQKEGALHA